MAQPEYVPVTDADRVRVSERLPTPDAWLPDRVGEVRPEGGQPTGPRYGVPGPDQGYALKLAHILAPSLVLAPQEAAADVIDGCLGVALKRSAAYGRAPVMDDLRVAFGAWGFLGEAPPELVERRRALFSGAAHHYNERRQIASLVPEATLRLTPAEIAERQMAGGWRALLAAEAPD